MPSAGMELNFPTAPAPTAAHTQPYGTRSPQARTDLQSQGKTDDQIADMWAADPKFKVNLDNIRAGSNSDPRATTAFLNYYLYGDVNYNTQQNVNSPKEDTSFGWLGSNALRRFLDKTWEYTGPKYQAEERAISQRYHSGQQGLLNTLAQGALNTVSGIAGPAKALGDVVLTTDAPFTNTSAADVIQPLVQGVMESKPVQEGVMPVVNQWNDYAAQNPTANTVNYALKAGLDALQVLGAGQFEKPFQAMLSTVRNPIGAAKSAVRGVASVHPIEALRDLRAGIPGGKTMAGAAPAELSTATQKALERSGMDPRVAKMLVEGGADAPAFQRILKNYQAAAKDAMAPNPKEIVGETALMHYNYLEDLRKGVGNLIGNVVEAHASEPIKLTTTYQNYVKWLENRGVYVNGKGELIRVGSSIPKSDLSYLQTLHDDISTANELNFKRADNIRRVIFKDQNLAERHGIAYGDDAKLAASTVHSDMLAEMGDAVPAYRMYAEPYAKIKTAQNGLAKTLGRRSYKELDERALKAGEVAKRMTGNASADYIDTFKLLEDTAREYGYDSGMSSHKQAMFEQMMSNYFPTYSPGGLTGQMENVKLGTDLGVAAISGSPYVKGRFFIDLMKKLDGKSPEHQLKLIEKYLGSSADISKATSAPKIEAVLQKMFGEHYVPEPPTPPQGFDISNPNSTIPPSPFRNPKGYNSAIKSAPPSRTEATIADGFKRGGGGRVVDVSPERRALDEIQ